LTDFSKLGYFRLMILSDRDILSQIEKKRILIDPFLKKNVQPSTVDLRLDDEVRVFDNWRLGIVDVKKKSDPSRKIKIDKSGIIVHPGEFILGSTVEKITLPDDIAAKLEGRSSFGRLGLIIHATAGYVDPGFSGWLTFEISNISRLPIRIYAGINIAQISFYQMTSPAINSYGSKNLGSKYQGQKGPTASRYWKDFEPR